MQKSSSKYEKWNYQWSKRRSGPGAFGYRTFGQVDRSRIVHSEAFRRLQAKTQVLELNESDFHRTRLTHSIEVAQVSTGLAAHLRHQHPHLTPYLPDDSLIEAISLAHDLGHPPFGHGGEVALNYMMHQHGGFEGNGQTLRIIARLEKFSDEYGMNLTKRTLLGVLKYPIAYSQALTGYPAKPKTEEYFHQLQLEQWTPPKCYYDEELPIIEWLFSHVAPEERDLFLSFTLCKNNYAKARFHSLDCSIMELADDISYSVHDFEDAVELNLFSRDDLQCFLEELEAHIQDKNFSFKSKPDTSSYSLADFKQDVLHGRLKKAISILIGYLVNHTKIIEVPGFQEPLFRYNAQLAPQAQSVLLTFKRLIQEKVLQSPETLRMVKNGQILLCKLFDALNHDTGLLSRSTQQRLKDNPKESHQRIICDYVSGMTNNYALKMYQRIFSPQFNSIFEL